MFRLKKVTIKCWNNKGGSYLKKQWWKESTVYQIYPRSFCDSNGDGIGDLPGIESKLDYLKELGIDVIWLSPIYDSPNADNGYDIRDYRKIMREFGTMEDFDRLLAAAHRKGLKIIMDLVVNHTSDEHEWFQKSRLTPKNEYRDRYFWRDGKSGAEPNNWASAFSGSAWKYVPEVGQYYLHLFAEKQVDLNWENETVRKSVYNMMRWWLDKGVDGFRMDVINAISKDLRFPDADPVSGQKYAPAWEKWLNGPRVHEFLQEMNQEVLRHYDIMTVGETSCVTPEDAMLYAGEDRGELNMIFQFEHVGLGDNENGKWNDTPIDYAAFREVMSRWQTRLGGKAWNSLYLGNHDQPRSVSRFGDDGKYRVPSAKLLATMLFTMQGTPFIYQGEEIGMTNAAFSSIEDYHDIETINIYREFTERNPADRERILRYIRLKGRDNARTPMQWNASDDGGFTSGTPWIALNPNYREINAEQALSDPESIFHYDQKLIALRKRTPCLVYGPFVPLEEKNPRLFCYLRTLEQERILVLLHFGDGTEPCPLPAEFAAQSLLISNYGDASERLPKELRPWEACVYRLR